MDVGTLEISGMLKWDANVDGIRLSSNFILVNPFGRFRLQTELRNNQKHYIRYLLHIRFTAEIEAKICFYRRVY